MFLSANLLKEISTKPTFRITRHAPLDNRVGQDRVRWRHTSSDGKSMHKAYRRHERPHCAQSTSKIPSNNAMAQRVLPRRLVIIHMPTMPGPSNSAKLFHSFLRYLDGNWMPARTSWTPSTSRAKYKVMVSSVWTSPRAYSCGRTQLVACGEKMRPATSEITSGIRERLRFFTCWLLLSLTGFRKIEFLLA